MTKKRRGFDLDLDADVALKTESVMAENQLSQVLQRRGPMASAIHETAGSLRDRATVEAQIRAENDALAHEHVRLKKLGLITDLISLTLIDATKLTRDRAQGDDPELGELIVSVRDIGLSNPIRVEAQANGRYELVQGYRRLAAYRILLTDTGDADRYGKIPATIMARGDTIERLYRQMVDENLVRKDISFAEMAQMAIHYAAEPQVAEADPATVVPTLFGSASYAKRSHIRSFVRLIAALGPDLLFAPEMPRNLGLALASRIEADPGSVPLIRQALQDHGGQSALSEQDVLRQFVQTSPASPTLAPLAPAPSKPDPLPELPQAKGRSFGVHDTWPGAGAPPQAHARPSRISFQLHGPGGTVRCLAYNAGDEGRIDLRLTCDVSRIDRACLEDAVQALLDRLDRMALLD